MSDVCVVRTTQTVERVYAVVIETEDDIPVVLAQVTRGQWAPVAGEARTELISDRQVIPDQLYDGAVSEPPAADLVYGDLAEESSLFDEPSAVCDVVKLAWKLRHGNDLDGDDVAILALVDEAVVPLGFADDDEGPDIEPEVVYE